MQFLNFILYFIAKAKRHIARLRLMIDNEQPCVFSNFKDAKYLITYLIEGNCLTTIYNPRILKLYLSTKLGDFIRKINLLEPRRKHQLRHLLKKW